MTMVELPTPVVLPLFLCLIFHTSVYLLHFPLLLALHLCLVVGACVSLCSRIIDEVSLESRQFHRCRLHVLGCR